MTGLIRGQSDKVEAPVGFEGEFWTFDDHPALANSLQ